MTSARIIADSLSPAGHRLTTFVLVFPRFLLAQLNTHRALSRNTASSRAVPTRKLIEAVVRRPFVPTHLGRNGRGMRAASEMSGWRRRAALAAWLWSRWAAVAAAWSLNRLGLHKQLANRLLEPWLYVTAIVSATEWGNFFNLRAHEDAQPEFQELALAMLGALRDSKPVRLAEGEWHIPFAGLDSGLPVEKLLKVAVARCARVSYLNFEGDISVSKDVALHDSLLASGHMSPFEHAARALGGSEASGNFVGFLQYRKTLAGENRADFDTLLRGPTT